MSARRRRTVVGDEPLPPKPRFVVVPHHAGGVCTNTGLVVRELPLCRVNYRGVAPGKDYASRHLAQRIADKSNAAAEAEAEQARKAARS